MGNIGIVENGGHPRRECLHLNNPPKGTGAVGAMKGGKQGGAKGKGKYNKGRKGMGTGKWGKGFIYKCRSPGKGAGKGFNQLDEDWYNAWGSDHSGNYDCYDDDYGNYNYGGNIGNVSMMLERGESGKTQGTDDNDATMTATDKQRQVISSYGHEQDGQCPLRPTIGMRCSRQIARVMESLRMPWMRRQKQTLNTIGDATANRSTD